MALEKRGRYYYGDTLEDLQQEMTRFSRLNEYVCDHFVKVVCKCGGRLFSLYVDEDAGAAVRVCLNCKLQHAIGDSGDYLDEAELERCICICDQESLELSVGFRYIPAAMMLSGFTSAADVPNAEFSVYTATGNVSTSAIENSCPESNRR